VITEATARDNYTDILDNITSICITRLVVLYSVIIENCSKVQVYQIHEELRIQSLHLPKISHYII
jgi:hypothetical protein